MHLANWTLAGVFVCTAVGCTSAPDEPMSRAEYLEAGNALCREAAAEAAELDFTSERTEAEREQAGIAYGLLLSDTRAAVLALRPPEEMVDEHQVVLDLNAAFEGAIQSQASMSEITERATAFEKRVAQMGFDDCA